MPGNFCYLGLAARMLPGAKIIHCVRDPRDIGLSIFTFRFHGAHGYAHDLGDLGWTIAQQIRLMDHWKAVLPNPILTVRLSDWVEDFEGTLARVLAHVGLPHDRRLQPLLRAQEPRAHGQSAPGAPTRQRPRPRPLARLRGPASTADRRTRPAGRAARRFRYHASGEGLSHGGRPLPLLIMLASNTRKPH